MAGARATLGEKSLREQISRRELRLMTVVEVGGMAYGVKAEAAGEVVRMVRDACKKPPKRIGS